MIRRVAVAAAVVTVAALAPVFASPASATDPNVNIPLGQATGIVVDQAHGLLFISGRRNVNFDGPSPGGVAVATVAGTDMHRIDGTTNAASLVLGPDGLVYVAEDSGAIAVIDPVTETVTSTYSTGAYGCPTSVAFAGANLWFGYACGPQGPDPANAQTSGIGLLNRADDTVTPNFVNPPNYGITKLHSVPGSDTKLIATGANATTDLDLLTVSGATATLTAQVDNINISDLAVSPDGSTLLVATQASGVASYSTADLSPGNVTYPTPGTSGLSSAFTADGNHVAVNGYGSSGVVVTYSAGSTSPIRTYRNSGAAGQQVITNPQPHGMAWAGNTLLAVWADYADGYPQLRVLNSALQQPVGLSLTAPASVGRGHTLVFTGKLLPAPAAGSQLHVIKRDLSGQHTVSTVSTDAAGNFSVRDVPQVGGTNTYTISFAGDASHAPTSRSLNVAVSRIVPSMSIRLDHATYNYLQPVHITAHLGTTYNGRRVTLYAQAAHHSKVALRVMTVDRHGNVSIAPTVSYTTAFTVSFAGDYRFAPRSVSALARTRVAITATARGSYGVSGAYHLYHASQGAELDGHVSPNKANNCAVFEWQYLNGAGQWVSGPSLSCQILGSTSSASAEFDGETGFNFRLRVSYGTDSFNVGSASNWVYVRFA
jgi:hypothetical protein